MLETGRKEVTVSDSLWECRVCYEKNECSDDACYRCYCRRGSVVVRPESCCGHDEEIADLKRRLGEQKERGDRLYDAIEQQYRVRLRTGANRHPMIAELAADDIECALVAYAEWGK